MKDRAFDLYRSSDIRELPDGKKFCLKQNGSVIPENKVVTDLMIHQTAKTGEALVVIHLSSTDKTSLDQRDSTLERQTEFHVKILQKRSQKSLHDEISIYLEILYLILRGGTSNNE